MIPIQTWVQIKKTVLNPSERPSTLPEDTLKVPVEMWVKGFLIEPSTLGNTGKIKTLTGRIVTGTIVQINPSYDHNYGAFVPEILQIDRMVKHALFGGEDVE